MMAKTGGARYKSIQIASLPVSTVSKRWKLECYPHQPYALAPLETPRYEISSFFPPQSFLVLQGACSNQKPKCNK